jgi:hypothetical protein
MKVSQYTDCFVTMDCSLTQLAERKNWIDYRLAPKSTSPLAQPFASLPFYSPDKSCMAQLTSNTDNKVNKLVVVFAILYC